jgi:hypothetical protein
LNLHGGGGQKLIVWPIAKFFHYRFSIVSDFRDCSFNFFFSFSKLLDPMLRDSVVRKIDPTSVGLASTHWNRHSNLVMHEQREQNDKRQRYADEPQQSSLSESHGDLH